jgi:hypothetical protein
MPETNLMKGSNDAGLFENLMHAFRGAQVGMAGAMYNDIRARVPLRRQFLPFEQSA